MVDRRSRIFKPWPGFRGSSTPLTPRLPMTYELDAPGSVTADPVGATTRPDVHGPYWSTPLRYLPAVLPCSRTGSLEDVGQRDRSMRHADRPLPWSRIATVGDRPVWHAGASIYCPLPPTARPARRPVRGARSGRREFIRSMITEPAVSVAACSPPTGSDCARPRPTTRRRCFSLTAIRSCT